MVTPMAKTLSVAALVASSLFTVQKMQVQPAVAVASDAAVYIGTTDAATPVRANKRASRSFRVFTIASAPKGVKMRGLWLKAVLREAGFEGKALKEAWAIAMRESTGRPTAHNGNRNTGDNSYGLFQINMIDGLGVDRRERYDLASNVELFDPLTNARIAYKMSAHGTNWSSWAPYNGGSKEEGFRKWLKKYPA